jgi:uncharacterized phage protein (TIGR02218 family)
MKTIPAGLLAVQQSRAATVAYALKITRTDAQVYAYTTHTQDVTLSGTTYNASQGLDVSGIVNSAGLGVSSLELTTLDDGTLFNRAEVLSGVWQSAAFVVQRYNWANPADGIEVLLAGVIGQTKLLRGTVVAELRDLRQYLQQPIGIVTSKTCRARFADHPTPNGNARCTLSAAAWSDARTVTAVSSLRGFTAATGTARAADWYADGIVTWLTGANAGMRAKIKTSTSGAVIALLTDMPHPIQVGDTLSALAGCGKRLSEDCYTRFNNVLNFQGEPHAPALDDLTQTPDPSA